MEYKFSELFEWTSGKPIVPTSGDIPVYGSNGIIGYTDTAKYENKIILGRVGAYCGSVAYCSSAFNATDNTLITTCDTSKILYYYAFYLLKLYNLNNFAGGAAQPLITQSILKKLKCNIPPLPTQRRIASILSAYDNLIENNSRRIKLLERMAEGLYKEWFVRFRFPGHENVEMENGLPKGWKRTKLFNEYKTSSGGTPSRSISEYYENGNVPWIKTGELQDCILTDAEEYITNDAVKHSSAKLFPKGTLLMAMYGVNIGKLAISNVDATCNQACCVFVPKRIESKYYLFYYLKSIREYLLSISFGAAQQNLSQELIKSLKVVIPDDATIHSFEQKIDVIYRQISNFIQQNTYLTRQRDLLLPRLMSGKLEVK